MVGDTLVGDTLVGDTLVAWLMSYHAADNAVTRFNNTLTLLAAGVFSATTLVSELVLTRLGKRFRLWSASFSLATLVSHAILNLIPFALGIALIKSISPGIAPWAVNQVVLQLASLEQELKTDC